MAKPKKKWERAVYGSYKVGPEEQDPLVGDTISVWKREGLKRAQVEQISGVRASTLKAWEDGTTLRPQSTTLRAVLRACGHDFFIGPMEGRATSNIKSALVKRVNVRAKVNVPNIEPMTRH